MRASFQGVNGGSLRAAKCVADLHFCSKVFRSALAVTLRHRRTKWHCSSVKTPEVLPGAWLLHTVLKHGPHQMLSSDIWALPFILVLLMSAEDGWEVTHLNITVDGYPPVRRRTSGGKDKVSILWRKSLRSKAGVATFCISWWGESALQTEAAVLLELKVTLV